MSEYQRSVLKPGFGVSRRVALHYGDLTMDLVKVQVKRGDTEIRLAPTEFLILRFLMEKPGTVVTRKELLAAVAGDEKARPRIIDMHIYRLRAVLKVNGLPDPIRTVPLTGYVLPTD